MPRRRSETAPPPPSDIDLNQVVAYNVRAARELRGWTQDELADQLEPYLGQRLSQASMSAIERAWAGDRRREFDAHEILMFAMVFDLPMIWFLLPPAGEHRLMRNTTRPLDELYGYLFGRPDQLGPVYERLREIGIADPTAADDTVENLTGLPSDAKQWSYRERRKDLLLALLDEHRDGFDAAVDELGHVVDHLRQVGLRGFLAENTVDDDFLTHDTPDATTRPNTRPNSAKRAGGSSA